MVSTLPTDSIIMVLNFVEVELLFIWHADNNANIAITRMFFIFMVNYLSCFEVLQLTRLLSSKIQSNWEVFWNILRNEKVSNGD